MRSSSKIPTCANTISGETFTNFLSVPSSKSKDVMRRRADRQVGSFGGAQVVAPDEVVRTRFTAAGRLWARVWPDTKCASVSASEPRGARCALGKRDGCAGCSHIAWPLDQRRRELTVTYAPGHSTRYDMRYWSRAADGAPPLLPYLCTRQTPLIFLSFIAFVIVRSLTYPIFLSFPLALPPRLYRPTSRLANKVQRSLLLAAIMSFISRGGTFCNKNRILKLSVRALGDTRRSRNDANVSANERRYKPRSQWLTDGGYLPESRTVYRGFDVSIGSISRTQEMMGVGNPTAAQRRIALWPISTTFVVGAWVIIGKPTGRFSAVIKKQDVFNY